MLSVTMPEKQPAVGVWAFRLLTISRHSSTGAK